MRLTLELVPPYVSERGLSSTLPKARWNRIRRGVAEAHGHRCTACGFGGRRESPLQCHEVWVYDPATVRPPTREEIEARAAGGKTRWSEPKTRESVRRGVRRLVDLVPLCRPCHLAKHSTESCFWFGIVRRDFVALGRDPRPGELLREALIREEEQSMGRTLARFVEVNRGVPLEALEEHCLGACAMRDRRADVEWASDYDGFDRLGENV